MCFIILSSANLRNSKKNIQFHFQKRYAMKMNANLFLFDHDFFAENIFAFDFFFTQPNAWEWDM